MARGQVALTPEEQAWLNENPVIRVANEDDWPPFDYSKDGEALGLSISYIELLAQKLGLELEFVNGFTWKQLLAKARNYEVDLLPCLWYAPERESFLIYTSPYIRNPQVIVVNRRNNSIENVEDLKGKRVAFIQDYASKDAILKYVPGIIAVEVQSPLEALLMVNLGSIDAYIDSLGMVSYQIDQHLLSGLRIASPLEMEGVENLNNLHMGVRRDWPLLHSALQKAMNAVSEEEKRALQDKWLLKIESEARSEFRVLEVEQTWLDQFNQIRFGYVQGLPPIQYEGLNQELLGLVGEYRRELQELFSSEESLALGNGFEHGLQLLERGDVDVLSTAIAGERPGVRFSEAFLSVPAVFITTDQTALISSLDSLQDQPVGFIRSSGLVEKFQQRIKLSDLHLYPNLEEGLRALRRGEIYALVSDLASSTYHLKKHAQAPFTISYTSDISQEFGFAVREDWSEMSTILNRYLLSVPADKKAALEHRWFNVIAEEPFRLSDYWRELGALFSLLLIVFASFFYWNRNLKREIRHRKQVEGFLVEARQLAEKSSLAKSEFLAMMSHEIRTPLNGILGMSQLLAEGELSPEQKEQCDVILRSGKSLLTIINDILDFSKIEAGKLDIVSAPFDLRKSVESVIRLYQATAEQKDLYLRLEFSEELTGCYEGDEGRLRQVILNLVSNAVKFTEEGGVCIRVRGSSGAAASELLSVDIVDTGIGIPEELQEKLFQQFTQVDASTTRKYGGTGLGLAISRRLIELMGGCLSLESHPGEGATFSIELELKTAELPCETEEREETLAPSNTVKVLLVEDNRVNQKIAEIQLRKLGCEVRIAENGLRALDILKDFHPDLMFMDCHMPEMDGYEATREIRKMDSFRHTPIIALTANALQGDREKCLQAGMSDYLAKPFDLARLSQLVELYRPLS